MPETDTSQLRAALSRAGLRATPQRIAIYLTVRGMKTHPSTEQVYSVVRQDVPAISFDTVNRTLQSFMSLGLIGPVESYNGLRRFEPDLSRHHHLHCLRCGKVFDLSSGAYDAVTVPASGDAGFLPLGVRVSVYGYCGDCRGNGSTPV